MAGDTAAMPVENFSGLPLAGWVPLSTVDWPGQLSAVAFLQGCPLRCVYCHNPHLLSVEAHKTLLENWQRFAFFLGQRQGLLDSVVISGGEPLIHHTALLPALHILQVMGYATGLHTSGYCSKRLAAVLDVVDWVGLDIKALPEHYEAITGSARAGYEAWACLSLLQERGIAHEVRITVHSSLHDKAHLLALARTLVERGEDRPVFQLVRTDGVVDSRLGPNALHATATIFQAMRQYLPAMSVR